VQGRGWGRREKKIQIKGGKRSRVDAHAIGGNTGGNVERSIRRGRGEEGGGQLKWKRGNKLSEEGMLDRMKNSKKELGAPNSTSCPGTSKVKELGGGGKKAGATGGGEKEKIAPTKIQKEWWGYQRQRQKQERSEKAGRKRTRMCVTINIKLGGGGC